MRSGRKGEEKGMYSKFHPTRIFFCFSYFILRKLRGEGRREFTLNSTPLEFSFVFFVSLFEDQRSRDESVFVSRSGERGDWGGRSPFAIRVQPRFDFNLNSTPLKSCFVLCFIGLKIRGVETRLFLFFEVKSGGVGGGAAPPHLLLIKWEEGEKRERIIF